MKDYTTLDYKNLCHEDLMSLPDKAIEQMTNNQAVDILQKQINSYYRGGDFRPRKHLAKALELAVLALKK